MPLTISAAINHWIPDDVKCKPLKDQYDFIASFHKEHPDISLCSKDIFGPFNESCLWLFNETDDFSDYNPELTKLNEWITENILLELSEIDYITLFVLIRIATGMLNKIEIPKERSLALHQNMVKNLREEHYKIVISSLPF